MPSHESVKRGLPPAQVGKIPIGVESDKTGESPAVGYGLIASSDLAGGGGGLGPFAITPDASYTIPDEITVGAGWTVAPSEHIIGRWGNLLSFGLLQLRFDASDLNDYSFYNDMLTLPEAWVPVTAPADGSGPPFIKTRFRLEHRSSGNALKQTDNFAAISLSYNAPNGIGLSLDALDSGLFASGDYLVASFPGGEFIVVPDGADFS